MDKEEIKLMRQAIKAGNLNIVKELSLNADLLNVDTVFGSWLHVSATHGKYEITEYFIQCGLDVNRNGDISGGNPVRSASENGHLDVIILLYKNGAKFDVSEARKNPLFAAICNSHYDVVKFLVDHGIDITASYSIGELDNVDAYEYARQFGQIEIANYLKDKLQERNN